MCGFVGFCGNGEYDRISVLNSMSDSIAHRGPDSDGKYDDGYCALGFRRLAIIDLEGGLQPMSSDDGRYTITFNGEIYNYREIRKKLEDDGEVFKTSSDTESILRAYIRYGKDAVKMLRGMFAFVIYDAETKKLFGARDRFGIKPFYYAEMNDTLIFGSEIKAFLHHPSFNKEINRDALKLYLTFQYSPLPETIFKGVFKLAPGCCFEYDGKMNIEQYFKPEYHPVKRSDKETADLIDKTVCSSVEYHQIADVEVGAFLSGGVDSSYIVSVAKPDKTYSVGFEMKGFDECSLAHDLCDKLGIKNSKKEITADEFFSALPKVQYHSDEPHANLSAVPLYFLSEMAAKDVKVVLSGEGADELFGGYAYYIESDWMNAYRKLPLSFRRKLKTCGEKVKNKHLRRFLIDGGTTVEEKFIGQAYIMSDDEANELLNEKYRSNMKFGDVTSPYFNDVKNESELTKKLFLDMRMWLPGDILLKADKMTMAHSLELRVPYLDSEVFTLASTLTDKQKLNGKETKRVFREAANRHIPSDWSNREKAGFLVPFRKWIKEEKYAQMVRDMFNRDFVSEFFDRQALLDMLDEHVALKKNNGRKIYTVYSFLIWYEQYFVLR